jgi:hypothetical protein
MSEPKIENIAGYPADKAPAAATFNRGAQTLAEIQRAQDARREHSRELGNRRSTPSK